MHCFPRASCHSSGQLQAWGLMHFACHVGSVVGTVWKGYLCTDGDSCQSFQQLSNGSLFVFFVLMKGSQARHPLTLCQGGMGTVLIFFSVYR